MRLLAQRGLVDVVAELVRVRRQGDYSGLGGGLGPAVLQQRSAARRLWAVGPLAPSPGNGKGVVDLETAIEGTLKVCEHFDIARDGVVVRLDGAFGNVPCITAILERGLAVVCG